jgi:hypothetical protein
MWGTRRTLQQAIEVADCAPSSWTDRSAHKHRRIARNQSLGFAQSRNGRRAAVQPEREWNAASFLDQAIGAPRSGVLRSTRRLQGTSSA